MERASMSVRRFLLTILILVALTIAMFIVGLWQGWSRVEALPVTDELDCPYKLEPAWR